MRELVVAELKSFKVPVIVVLVELIGSCLPRVDACVVVAAIRARPVQMAASTTFAAVWRDHPGRRAADTLGAQIAALGRRQAADVGD